MFAPVNQETGNEVGATLETSETVVAKPPKRREQRDLWDDVPLPSGMELRGGHEQPLTPEKQFEPLLPQRMEVTVPRTLNDDAKPESEAETKRETAADSAFTPLMPIREQQTSPLAKPPAAAAQQHAMHNESQRSTEREPDEIQIHIGRIEVLAVPQTQTTVIPKKPRKTPSLDDYLRRRDGRSL
jgi:hypothetical protein